MPSIKPHIETRDPSLVSEETAHRAYHALKAMCPEAGSWGFVQRVDIIAEPDTSDEARQRGARSSVRIYAVTSMDEHAFELTGGASPVVFAEPSAWRLLCGEKAPLADSKGNVTAPALSFLP